MEEGERQLRAQVSRPYSDDGMKMPGWVHVLEARDQVENAPQLNAHCAKGLRRRTTEPSGLKGQMLPPDPPCRGWERDTGLPSGATAGREAGRYSAIKDISCMPHADEGGKEIRRLRSAARMWCGRRFTSTMVDVILPARRYAVRSGQGSRKTSWPWWVKKAADAASNLPSPPSCAGSGS